MKVLKSCGIALGISALAACGGGSGDSGSTSQPQQPSSPLEVPIEASVIQSKALVNIESQTIVKVDSDIDFRLTSVMQVSNGNYCDVISIEGMTFTTLSTEVGECQFEYKVEPVEQDVYAGQASSLARVSVSETADNNTLPNLSETTDIDSAVTIDLSEELNSELDTSIYIVSEEVTLLGAGSVEVDSLNNTITYTPNDIGVTRIMYSMSDGSSTKLGNIDVAVSDTGNTPPIANDFIREGKLAKDMSVEIDLTDYVSDAEDSVILDTVRAYNAEAEITSTTEHTFTFQSSEPGPHEVAYTVTDGRGGYAVGQVYIEVEPDFSLVQGWEDITLSDQVIGSNITFSAPMSKAMADYVNADYLSIREEDGKYGPKGALVVQMNWTQAKSYCATRGGRLPLERELHSLFGVNPFPNENWPTHTPYWSANRTSATDGTQISLVDGLSNTMDMNGLGYVSCVYFDENVKDFSIKEINSDDYDDPRNTTRYISAVLVDPDGQIAPFQSVEFWTRNNTGGFGSTNNDLSTISITNSQGYATAIYEFTNGNEDFVMAQYGDSAIFTLVSLEASGFDVTNPDDWNISKIYGSTDISEYQPITSASGTKVALGETSEYITAISKTMVMGTDVEIKFGVDRTNTDSLHHGNTNIILQQVSSKAPDYNKACYIEVYGDCQWSENDKDTAGMPRNDNRWLAFIFDYYGSKIKLSTPDGIVATGTLLNENIRQLYYRISIDGADINIYQATSKDFSDETLSISESISSTEIDVNKFYYFGLSGGAHSRSGVHATVNYLDITQ
ncbi:Ig-like domain-containing protein [Vibrio pomeroyi]|uniref:Ig-like domain-containing protein n=1 Tax=Vibrio pomeroyi TaxID=198832 RepID=UPI0021C3519D|nr:hypothetical protein [Vibrio pomeroyi]